MSQEESQVKISRTFSGDDMTKQFSDGDVVLYSEIIDASLSEHMFRQTTSSKELNLDRLKEESKVAAAEIYRNCIVVPRRIRYLGLIMTGAATSGLAVAGAEKHKPLLDICAFIAFVGTPSVSEVLRQVYVGRKTEQSKDIKRRLERLNFHIKRLNSN